MPGIEPGSAMHKANSLPTVLALWPRQVSFMFFNSWPSSYLAMNIPPTNSIQPETAIGENDDCQDRLSGQTCPSIRGLGMNVLGAFLYPMVGSSGSPSQAISGDGQIRALAVPNWNCPLGHMTDKCMQRPLAPYSLWEKVKEAPSEQMVSMATGPNEVSAYL